MPDNPEEVVLSRRGDRYTLRRANAAGKVARISLTATALLAVRPLIQRECSQLLEARTGHAVRAVGAAPIIPMTIDKFDANHDVFHKAEVFLTLRDKFDNYFSFAMSPVQALLMAKRLAEEVRKLPSAPKTVQ